MPLFGAATVLLLVVAVGWMSQLLNASALPSLTNSSSSQSAAAVAAAAAAVYCGSFCDTNGAAHPRTRCISGFEICCGTVRRRYCCNVDDADHESFAASAVLAADDTAACADTAFSDPQLAAAAEAQEDQTVNASSRTTTSSPLPSTTLMTSDCGKYCDVDNQQNDRQYCSKVGMICCGTANTRYCCPSSGNYDPALSVDVTSCSNSMDFLLQWWYIVVPTVLILILLLAMVLCYAFRYQCWSSQRRSAGGNGGDGDVALQPASARDFDPTSTYAFQPPAYDSLPKDPPTYSEVVASDADPAAVTLDNAGFVGDDGRAPVTVPGGSPSAPVTAAAPVESDGVSAQPMSQRPAVAIPNVTPGLQQPTRPTGLPEGVYDSVLPPASPPLYTEAVTTGAAASTVAAVGGRNDVDGQRRRHGRQRRTRRRSSRERAQGLPSAAPPSYNAVVSSTDTTAAVRVHT